MTQVNGHGQAQKHAFVGPGEDEQADAGAEQDCFQSARLAGEAGYCAEDQGPGQRGERAGGGVVVDPVAEEADAENGEDSAEQSPTGRQPGLQHPADGGAHQRSDAEDGKPGRAEEDLPGGEDQATCRKVHRHVGGLHGDVDGLKVNPHGWGGVGEAAVGKGVGCEQEAEVVGNEGERDGDEGQQSKAQEEGGAADSGDSQRAPAGQGHEGMLDAREARGTEFGQRKGEADRDHGEAALDEHQGKAGVFRDGGS